MGLLGSGIKRAGMEDVLNDTYPASSAVAITPDDDTDLTTTTRGIYVGTGGDLAVILADDTVAVTFANVASGIVYPLRVKRVMEASTATDLVGLL